MKQEDVLNLIQQLTGQPVALISRQTIEDIVREERLSYLQAGAENPPTDLHGVLARLEELIDWLAVNDWRLPEDRAALWAAHHVVSAVNSQLQGHETRPGGRAFRRMRLGDHKALAEAVRDFFGGRAEVVVEDDSQFASVYEVQDGDPNLFLLGALKIAREWMGSETCAYQDDGAEKLAEAQQVVDAAIERGQAGEEPQQEPKC